MFVKSRDSPLQMDCLHMSMSSVPEQTTATADSVGSVWDHVLGSSVGVVQNPLQGSSMLLP